MVFRPRQLNVGSAQIHFAGDDVQPLERAGLNFFQQPAFAQQHAIGAGAFGFFQTQSAGGVGLRVQVEEQDPAAHRGDASGQVDRGGGLAYATFLVGDRDDFGWHAASLPRVTGEFKPVILFSTSSGRRSKL